MLNKLITLTFLSLSLFIPSQVSATLILEQYASGTSTPGTVGGYTMTDFAFINDGISVDSLSAPGGGTLDFTYSSGDLMMANSTADTTSWWINGESFDYDIYTTSEHVVTLLLPEDTFAFSFNVGADVTSTGNNAWLTATEINGSGIESKQWFNVNSTNTPGFGIYADNSSSECSSISSVTIDPLLWGFGNFSISRGSCASVPEPSLMALLSIGLLGMVAVRKLRNHRI